MTGLKAASSVRGRVAMRQAGHDPKRADEVAAASMGLVAALVLIAALERTAAALELIPALTRPSSVFGITVQTDR
jgi:hypothetical protein